MKRICLYTSDYGYGHAARDIALIRQILKAGFAEVTIKTKTACSFMRQSLPGCSVVQQQNDIGLVYNDETIKVDRDSTERTLESWVSSWDDYIRAEKSFCIKNRIDLIISDITPQPFLVAEELGIPGAGFSNFTWHYIFYNLLGKTPETERLREAYRAGDLAMVLPFHEEMGPFKARKTIPLVSRDISMSREAVRTKLGLKDDELLIYLGVGKSLTSAIFNRLDSSDLDLRGKRLLMSSGSAKPMGIPEEKIVRIPPSETESQNYLGIADLAVSKTGYSTVSEAIRGKVPMLLFRREGYEEDKLIARGVEGLGIGREIQIEDLANGRWADEVADAVADEVADETTDDLADLERYREGFDRLDDSFKADGTLDAVQTIKEMI